MTGRAAICADIHVANHMVLGGERSAGINQRCQRILDTLEQALAQAHAAECSDFIVAGDLFDTVRPSPQIIAAVLHRFNQFPGAVHVLLGNHDMVSTAEGDNALGPLAESGKVVVWEKPGLLVLGNPSDKKAPVIAMVPYHPGHAHEWFAQHLQQAVAESELRSGSMAVCLHLGLSSKAMREENAWMKVVHDAIDVELLAALCAKHDITAAYAGNWHHRFELSPVPSVDGPGVKLVQIGTLAPTGWDNPGMQGYGGVELWPPARKGVSRLEINGPRFVNRIPATKPAPGDHIAVALRVPPAELSIARAAALQAQAAGLIHEFIVEPESEQAQQFARSKVDMATSAGAVAQAVSDYCLAMKLPDGQTAAAVAATANRYLGGGVG